MKLRFTLLLLLLTGALFAQSPSALWEDVSKSDLPITNNPEKDLNLRTARSLHLNLPAMQQLLAKAPLENTSVAKDAPLRLDLPMPDGSMQTFEVVESPVMQPLLAAKFPEIKSFKAVSVSNKSITARIDVSPVNFHAMIDQAGRSVFIDPTVWTNGEFYEAYYEADVTAINTFACGLESTEQEAAVFLNNIEDFVQTRDGNAAKLDLRTFRIAIATTGEFSQRFGGTLTSVMSAINTAVNRANQVYERDAAIRLILMNNNDQLISLDPATDPYTNSSEGLKLVDQQVNVFASVFRISFQEYDLGHLFTGNCSDVGGVAPGRVCTAGRAAGVSCFSGSIESIALRNFAHEVGHQFSASHTFGNNCDRLTGAVAGQGSPGTAFELKCGVTIMSYEDNPIPYFHSFSIEQITSYSRQGNASGCAAIVQVQNNEPEAAIPYQNDFYIPIQTPFQLTGSATDADSDPLTYSWEQLDADKALFPVLTPSTSPTRVFPNLTSILNDFVNADGNLPDTTRDLTFRFLVRDNHPTAGASVWKEVKFRSTKDAGPFTVSYPNDDTVKWTAGTYTEVRWAVANTDKGLVNCKTVNIKLSTDGGSTFPYTLANRVVNNGLAKVPVPEIATNRARIRIEASENIFFDISNRNFQIFPATQPGFTVDVNPRAIPQQCLPTSIQYQIQIDDIQGFNSPVTLSLEGSLPGDATVSFSKNPILPSETSTLTIQFNQQVEGTFDLQVKATAGGVSQSIPIQLNTVSNDFSELVTLQPINGQSGIGLSTKFVWKKSPNANSYDFELATSPTFGATIVASVSNLQDTFYTPTQILLEENKLYFWRIRPSNECGANAFLEPSVFRTATIQCAETPSTNVPVNISGSGLPTVNTTLNVTTQGVINDLNLPLILASYQPVKSLRMSLISPSGTEVVLFDQQCGNTLKFETGFDDEAPTDVVCPPDDRLVVRPKQALAAFKGENTAGTWTLRTKVVTGGFGGGGSIEKWSIEFCSTLSPNNPTLVKNDTLGVPPGQTNTYTKNELEVQDSDNTPIQLKYLLVTIPAHGVLTLGGAPLLIGSTFTQQDITNFQLKYTHNGDAARLDNFLFVVEDGTGGWLPSQRAIIKIDENATVGVKNLLDENSILVFPNPARDILNVQLNQTLKGALTLSLYNIQGQEVQRTRFDNANNQLQLSTSQLASGMYFLTIRTGEGMVTKKVTVQR